MLYRKISLVHFFPVFGLLLVAFGNAHAQTVISETTSVAGTYTVPSDGQITFTITGADGGDAATNGGEGATVVGTFDVTAGQVIGYIVGEAGTNGTNNSAGGGGSTGVYIDTTLVLVAGGGGGGDNSTGAIGLGGNSGQDGDIGTGTGPGAGGTGGSGGGAGGGGNDSGGGGGVLSDGADGIANSGGAQATGTITFASGGSGVGSSNGGQGLTGGGGADSSYSGGGGGYSGGGGAGANGSAGGGGSFINTTATAYVSGTLTAGADGGGSESDGSIVAVLAAADADLEIVKTVDNPYPNEGDTVVYTLTVTNNGGSDATNVIVTDTLPAGLTWVSTTFSQGGCSLPSGVTCELGGILNANSATVTITATVDSGLGDSAVLTNTATVTADQTDPDLTNNDASADITTCPANNIHNIASVALSQAQGDTDATNDTDHICTQIMNTDYGDAPASYGDASHDIVPTLFLGGIPDAEVATQGGDALGDDNDGNDDEDGVVFTAPAGGGDNIIATVTVNNTTTGPITICAWMDIDVNGVFDAGERQCGSASTSFEWIVSSTTTQNYFSRFRICSTASECDVPSGQASDGEVEDYVVSYNPTVAVIGEVNLDATGVLDLLTYMGVAQMGREGLLDLLAAWDSDAVTALVDADVTDIIDAMADYLDPDGDGQVAVLKWDTLEERGTIGFYVERQNPDGSWTRINDDMLPGMIMAPMGAEYMLADPGAQSGNVYQYQLIEQEASGNTREYGPYAVEMP